MVSLKLPKNALLMTLSLLSFTASQASYQDLFQDAESEHAQFSARASTIDYEWDTAKIIMTVGTAGVITFGIGPRVADITNFLLSNLMPSLKWAYNRSEIGPITTEIYAKTQKWRDKIPESPFPPFTIKVSSLEMPLDEVLPSGLKDRYKHELKHLDQLLSEGITESHKISDFGWEKLPLYGSFENAQKSITNYLTSCLGNQDYLVGYIYKNSRYVVGIEKIFNKPRVQDDPTLETCEKDFYQIHRSLKQKGKGKKLERIPYYKEGSNPHPYLRMNNLVDIKNPAREEEVKAFILSFLKSLEHPSSSKKSLRSIFNNLVMLTSKKSASLLLGESARDEETTGTLNDLLKELGDQENSLEGGSSNILQSTEKSQLKDKGKDKPSQDTSEKKELSEAQEQAPSSSSSSSPGPFQPTKEQQEEDEGLEGALNDVIEPKNDVEAQLNNPASQSVDEEQRNKNFLPLSQKNKIQIYLAQDESGKPYQYLSFLFYTQDTERYNILLHIKDKVNHDFSLFSELKDDKDKDEEKALNLKGKRL
ncbi:hypothetical protein IM40_09395 (plasmid) [Candidatus Paracaedimonas acanthamoebae]|nr:hypothetical protein IM40_09395 [Candidatus Paracaedimonas acanthamoebae]